MRVLVTGGCGFIGSALVARLRQQPHRQIAVLDNYSAGTLEDLARSGPVESVTSIPGATELAGLEGHDTQGAATPVVAIEGDVRDSRQVLGAAQGADVVVHLAANTGVGPSVENPRLDFETNVLGSFNVMEAAREAGCRRVVYASSGAAIGECRPPIHEELPPKPVSPYGAGKLAGEAYGSAFFRTYGLETVGLRFGNVYGPGSIRKGSVVARFLRRALDGLPLEIYGDGSQTRDYIFIGDLLDAIEAAIDRPGIGGEVFQVATQQETSVLAVAQSVQRLIESETGRQVQIVHRSARTGDVAENYSDISKARRLLGFEPQVTLADGLPATLDYFLTLAPG